MAPERIPGVSQLFINVVGHNSSGKTTISKKLEKDFGFCRVSGDDFREFVHDHITYFQDTDLSYPNKRYNELNPLVLQYRFDMSWILLRAGQHVLFDGSGATREYRERYLAKAKDTFPGVTRVIIWADLSEEELLERLKDRGKAWLEQYTDLKKQAFQSPEKDEAEVVLRYDQHNYDAIKDSLSKLL
jgi:predicted kinase